MRSVHAGTDRCGKGMTGAYPSTLNREISPS